MSAKGLARRFRPKILIHAYGADVPEDFTSCLLSVRADAQRTVEPDQATLHASVTVIAASKSAAEQDLGLSTEFLTNGLGELGGIHARAGSPRQALAWAVHSMRTEDEYDSDKTHAGPTGRQVAISTLRVEVRDFAILANVLGLVTARDEVSLHGVSWEVDEDNPVWSLVRADAIRAALIKGQDYAIALGGQVERVQHVADAGLLGGDAISTPYRQSRAVGLSGTAHRTTLDPEPQVVSAVIDARLITTVGELPRRSTS